MADTVNLTIDQGSTYTHVLTVTDPAGNKIDIQAYSVRSQIRKTKKAMTKLLEITAQISDGANGQITLSLTAAQTAAITCGESKSDASSKYYYDVEIYKMDGPLERVYRVVEGSLTMNPEVTR